MACARITSILAAIAMASPVFADEIDMSDPVGFLLRHDLVVDAVIVDRAYVEAAPRSALDWAFGGSLGDQGLRPWRDSATAAPSACRLGVRVVETYLGESADFIEVDLWFLDRQSCESPLSGFSADLSVGSRHLFLLNQSSDGRWLPETYYWRAARFESGTGSFYESLRRAAENLAGAGYAPRELAPVFVTPAGRPPDVRAQLSDGPD